MSRATSVARGAVGGCCAATVVVCPAATLTACPEPTTDTTPSVVTTSLPSALTATWNAVPCTITSAVGVMSSYFADAGSG